MYSRGNYNFLRVVNARECASASDPFTVASTFEGTRVFSREECILACERLACVARASREVCYLSRERYCTSSDFILFCSNTFEKLAGLNISMAEYCVFFLIIM